MNQVEHHRNGARQFIPRDASKLQEFNPDGQRLSSSGVSQDCLQLHATRRVVNNANACTGTLGQEGTDPLSPWARWAMLVADTIDPLVPNTNESVLLAAELPTDGDTEPDE